MIKTVVEKTRAFMTKTVLKAKSDPFGLIQHVEIVERWAKFILKSHPEADEETVLLGVWLHDVGHYPVSNEDHAIRGEKIAISFLKKLRLNKDKLDKAVHCVRAHRCKDVMPGHIEARIVACADSAAHLLDFMYLDVVMCHKNSKNKYSAIDKLERDWRDVAAFPEVKNKLEKLYIYWKQLIIEFDKINEEI